MRRKILTGVGLATVLTLSAGAPAASADSPTPGPSAPGPQAKPDLTKRAARLCKRVPKVEQRVTRLTARFSGDPNTRGSVLWLQAKADKVRPKDAALADIIDGRAKIRQSRLATLKLRADQLPKVAAWCKAHGR
ncbi:MAG: hypothetical protein QOE54_1515 [Streptosporangiaceae bacterium]|jgi:hypothetical protein|nr:hypothetical protein [Streptosporangiaceae bacterium]MDX6429149.1 hypothetical protein [Streptosporangiaceae bacterium]